MLVVHGIWVHGSMWLWAEDTTLPARTPAPPAPRTPPAPRNPRPHPFAAPAAELADALAGLPDLARKAVDDDLTLLLPTTDGSHRGSRR